MNEQGSSETPASDVRLESIYARVMPRMLRIMLVASVVLLVPAFRFYGWAGAIGFAAGAAVSYINFLALARGVESLAERIVNQHSQEKGRRIVLRFLMRYGLVAVVAYAIFKGSALAFRGFLWGLCLPVAAMMLEAGIEAYAAFRRN
ncbi:MAG: ATP synthase subunit I [Acidobacteriia bacterium]|nr:ATP synthase subunit I [Terriglobia bacterium]